MKLQHVNAPRQLARQLLCPGATLPPKDVTMKSVVLALSVFLLFPAASKASEVELFEDSQGEFRFNIVASNHEVVLSSEGYDARVGAASGVLAVLEYGSDLSSFAIHPALGGGFYFNLMANNGEVVGTSEIYSTKGNAKAGAGAVRDAVTELLSQNQKPGAGFKRFVGQDGLFYFHLTAQNGEIILASEGYETEGGALNGVFSVIENGESLSNFDIFEGIDGQFYFSLFAGNGKIIGVSEGYAKESTAETTAELISTMIKNGLGAF